MHTIEPTVTSDVRPLQNPPLQLTQEFDGILDELARAESPTDALHRARLFNCAEQMLARDEGIDELWRQAHRFDEAGVFAGGPWADPSRLQVSLVAGTMRGPGQTPVLETLSELRMLAIARERAHSDAISAEEARQFLSEVLAHDLSYLISAEGATESERAANDRYRRSHQRLFELIANEIGIGQVLGEVVDEAQQILAQRPISTWSVRRMISRAWRWVEREGLQGDDVDRLHRLVRAATGPTVLSRRHQTPRKYQAALRDCGREQLENEARIMAGAMKRSGLVAPQHAVLVRYANEHHEDLLAVALGLHDGGVVDLQQNADLVHRVIDAAVFGSTASCLYGLADALDRNLFARPEVSAGIERLLNLELLDDVKAHLSAHRSADETIDPSGVLLAGVVAVLGQPLGVGQGNNPTCQSARGISLWAQHDPAHLVELIIAAARDGRVELMFDGQRVGSDQVVGGVATSLDLDLDPVSIVLVPHLDRLYVEFMRRSIYRTEDAHKWVNPALYGRWVQHELASAFSDVAQTTVWGFATFVRRFFATHHPHYSGGHRLMYPNPVGLVVTNHQARYLGPHAVSIQRIDEDPEGWMRVYFYNPNNEGRQDWGHGVVVSVSGHGELPGESSLPFDDFAARVYAFHYNPNESGDLTAVDDQRVAEVVDAARTSWGDRFIWLDEQVTLPGQNPA